MEVTTNTENLGNGMFTCDVCSRSFIKMKQLACHKEKCVKPKHRTHSSSKVHCQLCFKKFSSFYHRNRHENTVHRKTELCTCPICGTVFTRIDHLTRHQASVHPKKDIAEQDESSSKESLEVRLRSEIVNKTIDMQSCNKAKPYWCDECSQQFAGLHFLMLHRRLAHRDLSGKSMVTNETLKKAATIKSRGPGQPRKKIKLAGLKTQAAHEQPKKDILAGCKTPAHEQPKKDILAGCKTQGPGRPRKKIKLAGLKTQAHEQPKKDILAGCKTQGPGRPRKKIKLVGLKIQAHEQPKKDILAGCKTPAHEQSKKDILAGCKTPGPGRPRKKIKLAGLKTQAHEQPKKDILAVCKTQAPGRPRKKIKLAGLKTQDTRLVFKNCETSILTKKQKYAQKISVGKKRMYLCQICRWIEPSYKAFQIHRAYGCAVYCNSKVLSYKYQCRICDGSFRQPPFIDALKSAQCAENRHRDMLAAGKVDLYVCGIKIEDTEDTNAPNGHDDNMDDNKLDPEVYEVKVEDTDDTKPPNGTVHNMAGDKVDLNVCGVKDEDTEDTKDTNAPNGTDDNKVDLEVCSVKNEDTDNSNASNKTVHNIDVSKVDVQVCGVKNEDTNARNGTDDNMDDNKVDLHVCRTIIQDTEDTKPPNGNGENMVVEKVDLQACGVKNEDTDESNALNKTDDDLADNKADPEICGEKNEDTDDANTPHTTDAVMTCDKVDPQDIGETSGRNNCAETNATNVSDDSDNTSDRMDIMDTSDHNDSDYTSNRNDDSVEKDTDQNALPVISDIQDDIEYGEAAGGDDCFPNVKDGTANSPHCKHDTSEQSAVSGCIGENFLPAAVPQTELTFSVCLNDTSNSTDNGLVTDKLPGTSSTPSPHKSDLVVQNMQQDVDYNNDKLTVNDEEYDDNDDDGDDIDDDEVPVQRYSTEVPVTFTDLRDNISRKPAANVSDFPRIKLTLANCRFHTLNLEDLLPQEISVDGHQMYLCMLCKWISRSKQQFQSHRKYACAIEQREMEVICKICNKQFYVPNFTATSSDKSQHANPCLDISLDKFLPPVIVDDESCEVKPVSNDISLDISLDKFLPPVRVDDESCEVKPVSNDISLDISLDKFLPPVRVDDESCEVKPASNDISLDISLDKFLPPVRVDDESCEVKPVSNDVRGDVPLSDALISRIASVIGARTTGMSDVIDLEEDEEESNNNTTLTGSKLTADKATILTSQKPAQTAAVVRKAYRRHTKSKNDPDTSSDCIGVKPMSKRIMKTQSIVLKHDGAKLAHKVVTQRGCSFRVAPLKDQEVRLFNCPTGCLTLGDVEAQLVYPRGTEAMYLCKMCKLIFCTRGKFRNHRQFNCAIQRIGNNQLLYSCNICNGLFSRHDLLPKINTSLGTLAVRKPSSYKVDLPMTHPSLTNKTLATLPSDQPTAIPDYIQISKSPVANIPAGASSNAPIVLDDEQADGIAPECLTNSAENMNKSHHNISCAPFAAPSAFPATMCTSQTAHLIGGRQKVISSSSVNPHLGKVTYRKVTSRAQPILPSHPNILKRMHLTATHKAPIPSKVVVTNRSSRGRGNCALRRLNPKPPSTKVIQVVNNNPSTPRCSFINPTMRRPFRIAIPNHSVPTSSSLSANPLISSIAGTTGHTPVYSHNTALLPNASTIQSSNVNVSNLLTNPMPASQIVNRSAQPAAIQIVRHSIQPAPQFNMNHQSPLPMNIQLPTPLIVQQTSAPLIINQPPASPIINLHPALSIFNHQPALSPALANVEPNQHIVEPVIDLTDDPQPPAVDNVVMSGDVSSTTETDDNDSAEALAMLTNQDAVQNATANETAISNSTANTISVSNVIPNEMPLVNQAGNDMPHGDASADEVLVGSVLLNHVPQGSAIATDVQLPLGHGNVYPIVINDADCDVGAGVEDEEMALNMTHLEEGEVTSDIRMMDATTGTQSEATTRTQSETAAGAACNPCDSDGSDDATKVAILNVNSDGTLLLDNGQEATMSNLFTIDNHNV